jgi:hypothetical protein
MGGRTAVAVPNRRILRLKDQQRVARRIGLRQHGAASKLFDFGIRCGIVFEYPVLQLHTHSRQILRVRILRGPRVSVTRSCFSEPPYFSQVACLSTLVSPDPHTHPTSNPHLARRLTLLGWTNCFFGPSMTDAIATDSLGSRIISAARLAVEAHLEMDRKENAQSSQKAQAMVGGADRRVTDDNSSVVSGPLSVVTEKNN